MKVVSVCLTAACLFVTSCQLTPSKPLHVESAREPAPLYYHIFVRSFADSDNDQHGDLRGIVDSLDYLQSLGVTGLLLTPLYPSQFYHNYFADDFYGIDPEFGDMEAYRTLVAALKRRGMTLILDQEIQYVSGQHPWYATALSNPDSPVDGFVSFNDEANTEPVGTLFGRTSFEVWPNQRQTIVTVDMLNPAVREYFERYLLFWLDPNGDGDFSDGVDGYRVDHMMDDLDNAGVLTGLFEAFWKPIFDRLRATKPDVLLVAEQADWGYGDAYIEHGGVDWVFGFPLWDATKRLDARAFAEAVSNTRQLISSEHSQFVFIENHDTHRFASHAPNRPDVLALGAAVNLLTGWVPIVYYGQELGMSGEKIESALTGMEGSKDDVRDIPVRQAFRWHGDDHEQALATWYRSDPKAYPLNDSHHPGDGVSVSEQEFDSDSLLNTYRALSRLRRAHVALSKGTTDVLASTDQLVVLKREYGDDVVFVGVNFSDREASLTWSQSESVDLLYGHAQWAFGEALVRATFKPYGVAVWR